MTLAFDAGRLAPHLSHELALAAMRECFDAEARGTTVLPPRTDVPSPRGFFRVMPAVFDDVMGLKIMTMVEGLGNRYLVLLYDVEKGDLLATFDADELTRLRTAATTALAGERMAATPPDSLAVLGSGFEAVGHLRMLASIWPLRSVTVFSPSAQRRARFAEAMARDLGIAVEPAATAEEAVAAHSCVVLATKSKRPVVDGNAFRPQTVVLSIGSTRLDFRELDTRTLERAAVVVVDHPHLVMIESGDIAESVKAGALDERRLFPLASLVGGAALPATEPGRDLLVFKSVGTALQDLALARALYRDRKVRASGVDVGELTGFKPFSAKAFPEESERLAPSGA